MKLIFHILIFSLIITFIAIPRINADNDDNDPCAKIAKDYKGSNGNPDFSLKYSDVIACYESFPYERKLAERTIDTIKKTLQGFYVFLSKAREEPDEGFSFRPVDLIKELDSLLSNNYTTDYRFMTDVHKLIAELKDAHLSFTPSCYKNFEFSQQLSLYSVINKDDVQVIKIFDDNLDQSTVDCEVTHIDGRPPIEVINEFADLSNISRDKGVRFNSALASLLFNDVGELIEVPSDSFTTTEIPEKSSVEYSIVCANNTSKKFTREWKITPRYDVFETSKDYWNMFCLATDILLPPPIIRGIEPKIYKMRESEIVFQTAFSKFFILSDNKTGVVIITSFEVTDLIDELLKVQQGFNILEDRGVQKLVLDLSYNTGGYINLALFIVYLLFPSFEPSFETDMVVSDLSREVIIKETSMSNLGDFGDLSTIRPPSSLNLTKENFMRWAATTANNMAFSGGNFNAFSYKNSKTDKHFQTVEEFIGNNTYIRGGIPTQFTSKFVSRYTEAFNIFIKLISGNVNTYEWKSEDMIILTNGICGSACAMATQRMAEKYNVSTVAVGGYKDTPLSYASFPGSQVLKFDELMMELSSIEIDPLQNDLVPDLFMIRTVFSFTIKEIYDVENPDDMLEFTYKPADHRISYNELSARDRSLLWLEVVDKFL